MLALRLLIPLVLLAVSCGSNSGTATPEDSTLRSTTSAQSLPSRGNSSENNDVGGIPTADQQSQINHNYAVAISAGEEHSCAIHQNGNISCWGNNYYGQLGNNTEDDSLLPVAVEGISDAAEIGTGLEHTCALHQNGSISCWGESSDGQLGSDTEEPSSVPVAVIGVSDATAMATGLEHTCALHQNGSISCWGANWDGQLGNNTEEPSSVPVAVEGIEDATAISTGGGHSCAIHRNGTISCWGRNDYGQLGNNTGGTEYDRSPAPVAVEGIEDATAISTGGGHSCAIHQNGTISCWGNNYYGQLGNGTGAIGDKSLVPVRVNGVSDAVAISAGGVHSCALFQNSNTSCWGRNDYGQLGNNTGGTEYDRSSVPVAVEGIEDATAISAGGGHSCAIHQNGNISCWGNNHFGQLGNNTGSGIGDDHNPLPARVKGI